MTLFAEIGMLLCKHYQCQPSEWLCERTLAIILTGQFFIKRDNDGNITTYVGWWLIDRDKVDKVAAFDHVPDDIRTGNTIWVMDAVSDGSIREAQRALRRAYPRTGEVSGVAWLRRGKPVISMRQKGV